MPNWCMNNLRLDGDVAAVLRTAIRLVGHDVATAHDVARAIAAPTGDDRPDADWEASLYHQVLAASVRRDGSALSFQHHVPKPEGLDQQPAEGRDLPPWYQWCLANWGTKWDACEVQLQDLTVDDAAGTAQVTWTFDTAWGPPGAWLATLCNLHPDVRVQLFCDGEMDGALFHYDRQPGNEPTAEVFQGDDLDEAREFYVNRLGHDDVPDWCGPQDEEDWDDDQFADEADPASGAQP